jgi:hypothetical protein
MEVALNMRIAFHMSKHHALAHLRNYWCIAGNAIVAAL